MRALGRGGDGHCGKQARASKRYDSSCVHTVFLLYMMCETQSLNYVMPLSYLMAFPIS